MFQIYRAATRRRNDDNHEPTNGVKKIENNKIEPEDIGIAGIRQLMDPSYDLCDKCFWLCALLVCCAVCLYQAITLSIYYISNPITIEIQMMRNDTIQFPAITICPLFVSNDFTNTFESFRKAQCEKHNMAANCGLDTLYEKANITLEDMWQDCKVLPSQLEIKSTCGTTSHLKGGCHDGRVNYTMHHQFVKTIYGTCLTSATHEPMLYKGPDTYISFKRTNLWLPLGQIQEPLPLPVQDFDRTLQNHISSLPISSKIAPSGAPERLIQKNILETVGDNAYENDTVVDAGNDTLGNGFIISPPLRMVHRPLNAFNCNLSRANVPSFGPSHSSIDQTWKASVDFTFFLHEPSVVPRHDTSYFAESVFKYYFTELRISVKEYRYLNTKENPCTDEKTFVNCRNNCIDKKLQAIIPCRFPFMADNPDRDSCINSSNALEETYMNIFDFYRTMKLSDCDCKRKCNDIIYVVNSDVGFKTPDSSTTLHLYYPLNMHEVVIENFAYSLASLLSDIAGSVGFYMGVCVLAILEIFDNIIRKKVRARFQRRNKDVELGPTRNQEQTEHAEFDPTRF